MFTQLKKFLLLQHMPDILNLLDRPGEGCVTLSSNIMKQIGK